MLILNRRLAEEIIITASNGERVRIQVKCARASRVSLAIDAPPQVKVLRGELEDRDGD